MNPDLLPELVQRGFRFSLGATSSFLESLQDPQKRDENLQKLTTDFNQLAEEWVAKGEVTEREARNFVDTLVFQKPGSPTGSTGSASSPTVAAPIVSGNLKTEIQALTDQVIALRRELEDLDA